MTAGGDLASNFTRQNAIVLNLQRACEASIDAAVHKVRILGERLDDLSAFARVLMQQALP